MATALMDSFEKRIVRVATRKAKLKQGRTVNFLGIDWVGINAENGRKLLLSLAFIAAVLIGSASVRAVIGFVLQSSDHDATQTRFWARQGVSLVAAIVMVVGLLSIWFNDPTRLATAFGLMSAGLAFALQQVITALAGYFVILRGATFTVGDRISMGGVRGDVLQLGFIQTTILEMGQPPGVQSADPAMWVKSRQFTGRIVTVSNSKIFSEPVFNYSQGLSVHLGRDGDPGEFRGRSRAGRRPSCSRQQNGLA